MTYAILYMVINVILTNLKENGNFLCNEFIILGQSYSVEIKSSKITILQNLIM